MIVLDDLDQRVAGDAIYIDTVTVFDRPNGGTRSEGFGVLASHPNPAHDPGVVRAHVYHNCFCAPGALLDQTVTATITLTSVSTSAIQADIDLSTEGGLPLFDPIGAQVSHTTRISGTFVAD